MVKMEFQQFTFENISPERPLVIAGPCSAESEKQMLKTAKQLAKQNIKIFRAGIWKPRTRPGAFEGCGSIALPWMKAVKEQTGMYTATEVANEKHVYEALKWEIDILWIGARTTVNPFFVQEIADTLKGTDVRVMVKNPVNPDLELWIGAIERLYNSGIKRLAACHRGFSVFEKQYYRNDPNWQIPLALKTRYPDLPIITDPSHICGNRTGLLNISQMAMDMMFDGLIIESHINPDRALSDANQQITPATLEKLLGKLVIRQAKEDSENDDANTLKELRKQIDQIDDAIIDFFEKRMNIAEQIGYYKKEKNISIFQFKRWKEILNKHKNEARKKGLSIEFIEIVFKALHQEAINRQTEVMNKNEK